MTNNTFAASSFTIIGNGNEFIFLVGNTVIGNIKIDVENGKKEMILDSETIATIKMSPQTAKDLSLLLSYQVASHEANFGEIETNYTRQVLKK